MKAEKTVSGKKIIDIGYGYLKYKNLQGKIEKVKAVIGELGDSLALSSNVDVIMVDGIKYVIGADVYDLGKSPITANESEMRYANIAYKVIGLYALAKTYEPDQGKLTIMTGLPFQNMDEATEVKALFEGIHEVELNGQQMTLDVEKVMLAAQGLGSYYSLVGQRGNDALAQKILLVDLGFGTINYLPINKGNIETKTVKTNKNLGIQYAYRKIADEINIEFKADYKYYDVDRLLDEGVPVQDVNKGKSYTPIVKRTYVQDAFTEYAKSVWADILDKYNGDYRADLDEVVFSGGTAERVESHLKETKRFYCSVIENAQDAQVLGYDMISKKLEGSK